MYTSDIIFFEYVFTFFKEKNILSGEEVDTSRVDKIE